MKNIKCLTAALWFLFNTGVQAQIINPPDEIPACPAVNSDQARLAVTPKFSPVDFETDVNFSDPDILDLGALGMRITSSFETNATGEAAKYGEISTVDTLSIGRIQWNWEKKKRSSLVTEFFKGMPESYISSAENNKLRQNLFSVWQLSNANGSISIAQDAVNYLAQFARQQNSSFARWLRSDTLRDWQESLVEERLKQALLLTHTWMRDRGYNENAFERTFFTMINFNVHGGLETGNLRQIWSPQVEAFRNSFADKPEMFAYVVRWIKSCRVLTEPGVPKKERMLHGQYMLKNGWWGIGNVERWTSSSAVNNWDEVQVDLFAYAFLYATRSITMGHNDEERPGYFQLGVLNRAGALIFDKGAASGFFYDRSKFR